MDAVEIGATLRGKRVEQELSVDDVAARMNVTAQTVHHIEEGNHDKLPGRVFVRGYLRYYARLLGVNPGEIIEEQEQSIPEPTDDDLDYGQDERVLRQTRIWGSVAIGAVLALLVYAWWAESAAPPDAMDAVDTMHEDGADGMDDMDGMGDMDTVSYTHLTLPTILRV